MHQCPADAVTADDVTLSSQWRQWPAKVPDTELEEAQAV